VNTLTTSNPEEIEEFLPAEYTQKLEVNEDLQLLLQLERVSM
jgi:hypothetical protein